MTETARLLVTTRRERLSTREHPLRAWDDWALLLREHATTPTRYELSDPSGAALVHWMVDAGRSHLSLWDSDTCYYLMRSAQLSPPESGFVDLGWSSYPAWSVTEDFELAREAARLYWEKRALLPRARWASETLEL